MSGGRIGYLPIVPSFVADRLRASSVPPCRHGALFSSGSLVHPLRRRAAIALAVAPLTVNSNSGFITLPLAIAAGAAVVILGLSVALKVQTDRLEASQARYTAFVADVKAKGEEQERRTKETILRNQKAKESADAENKRLRAANATLAVSLRDARAHSGILSAAPTGSSRPDLACYDRANLESALQRFDSGVTELVSAGDQALIDLDTAREWAQGR